MVVACIFSCVEDGGLYDFDAVDLPRFLGKKQRYRPRAAIGVDDGLCSMQVGIGKCLFIKAFCLSCIDLKEGARRDVEVQPPQRVDNRRSSPEQLCVAPHDDVVAIGLDILMDTDEVWQTLAHHANKVLCTWELLCCSDNDRHEIVAASDAPDNVAQNPLVGVLVIDRNMKLLCNLACSICKVIVLRTLDVAVFRIDNPVTALCKAADHDLTAISPNRKLHLVPIVPRFFCTQCFPHGNLWEFADMGQCVYDLCTFCMQLSLIGEVLELTAAALLVEYAERCNAVGTLVQDLLDASARIAVLYFFYDDGDGLAGERIRDKDSKAVIASDPLPARPEAVNLKFIGLSFTDGNRLRDLLYRFFLLHRPANVTFSNSSIGCVRRISAPCATSSSLARNPQRTPTANAPALRAVSMSTSVSPKYAVCSPVTSKSLMMRSTFCGSGLRGSPS